jgi:hypothetical protein
MKTTSILVALSGLTTISGSAHERGLAERTAVVAGGTDFAMRLANPVANLISVPVQNNLDFGIGPNDATRSSLSSTARARLRLPRDDKSLVPCRNQMPRDNMPTGESGRAWRAVGLNLVSGSFPGRHERID